MASTLATLLVKLGVQLDGSVKAEAGLKQLKKKAHEFGVEADTTSMKAKKLAGAVGKGLAKAAAFAATAIAALGAAALKLVFDKTASIDATNKLSTALGVEVEELQRLQFAAERSGLDQEKFRASMLKLNTAVLDLENGTGAAKDTFADLGIRLEDLKGRTHSEQIGLIGDRLNEVASESERSAMAAKIFGEEAGPNMASLLAEGTAGLEALMGAAQNVQTQEQADQASALADAITNAESTIQGLVSTVAVELMPTIQGWIDSLMAWFAANEEMIKQDFASVLTFLVGVVQTVAGEVGIFVTMAKSLAEWLAESSEGSGVFAGALNVLWTIIKALLSPFSTIIKLINGAGQALNALGVVSDETAARMQRNADRMLNTGSQVDQLAGHYDGLANAIDGAASAQFDFAADNAQFDAVGTPEEQAKRSRAYEREKQRKLRANRGVRTPKAKAPKKEKTKKEKPKGVTLEELRAKLIAGALGGNAQEAFRTNLQGLSKQTSIADTKPSVAITYNQTTIHNKNDVAIDVKSTGPVEAAKEMRREFEAQIATITERTVRGENSRAAQSLSPVVR